MTQDEIDNEIQVDNEGDDDNVYVTHDIATYPSDLTIKVLKDMWDNNEILIPGFQRNFVWTINQASLLVESFLLGLPVPQAFFTLMIKTKTLLLTASSALLP